jgi:hypothetical protein
VIRLIYCNECDDVKLLLVMSLLGALKAAGPEGGNTMQQEVRAADQ